MNETLDTINQGLNLVLTLCGIVGAVVAALAGTRWGKAKAVQTAADVADLIQDLATVAVNATEQLYRKIPAPESDEQAKALRSVKLDEARGKLLSLLPEGVSITPDEADAAIEAAVHRLNEAKR